MTYLNERILRTKTKKNETNENFNNMCDKPSLLSAGNFLHNSTYFGGISFHLRILRFKNWPVYTVPQIGGCHAVFAVFVTHNILLTYVSSYGT